MEEKSICKQCGKPISTKKKFCDLHCFGLYNSKKNNNLKSIKHEINKCIDCGVETYDITRNRCSVCYTKYNKEKYKKYIKENKDRIYKKGICPICKKEMTMWREDQLAHAKCRAFTQGDYNRFLNRDELKTHGRKFVEDIGINIPEGYVVHHLDENPTNNVPENLVVCSRKHHNQLHQKFNRERTILLREFDEKEVEEIFEKIREEVTKEWIKENYNDLIFIPNSIIQNSIYNNKSGIK